MKIGIVSPYYIHKPGGVQTLIKTMVELLNKRGHQAIIIAPRPRLKADLAVTPKGVILLGNSKEVNFKAPLHTTLPIAASTKKTIQAILHEHKFDLLNIHEPWMPMLPYQFIQQANCPVVGTLHARWPRSLVNKSLEKARAPYVRSVMHKMTGITAVSTVAAQNAYDVDPEIKIELIPNALHLNKYRRQIRSVRKPTDRYFLYLNRLENRKGPTLLLKAYRQYFKSAPVPPPRLVIAGGGPQLPQLREYTARHGLNSVSFEGFVDEARKLQLYANAWVYISPAPYGESFGIVLLEAMAAGVPIVAGNNDGYSTVLQGEGALSLVDPKDTVAFSQRLRVMSENQKVRQAWRNWARQAIKNYDYNLIIGSYERYFESIAKS